MKMANSIDNFISKYLTDNKNIADDILSLISSEAIVSAKDPRVAHVVKHLGRAIVSNPDLLHAMVMEDFMEAEAERDRDRQAKDEAMQAKDEAVQAKRASDKIAEAERKEKEFWKAQFEALQQKNKD